MTICGVAVSTRVGPERIISIGTLYNCLDAHIILIKQNSLIARVGDGGIRGHAIVVFVL